MSKSKGIDVTPGKVNDMQGDVPFRGYANYYLPESQKSDFEAYIADSESWSDFVKLVDSGYRFAVKWDARSQAYMCSVSNQNLSHPDLGIVYTERSSNPIRAMLKAAYGLKRCDLEGNLARYVAGPRIPAW